MKKVFSMALVLMMATLTAHASDSQHPKKHAKHVKNPKHSKPSRISSKKPELPVQKNIRNTVFSTVVLDAGHGGHDLGGIPQNIIPEKGVALDVVLRLNRLIQRSGLRTVLTRKDDTFIPLPTRVAISNAHPEAVFVSIHFDATPRRSARGVDTYYATSAEAPLANCIQRRILAVNNAPSRGIVPARFCVLRKTTGRAVLVECGFLTNPEDAALASLPAYRQKMAEQICAGILDYRRSLQ